MTTAPSTVSSTFDESWESLLAGHWNGISAAGVQTERPALQDREAAWLEDALLIADFSAIPLRRLRAMSNRLYRMLDADFPPAGAMERYEVVTGELALRAAEIRDHTA
jgi:hypothetical protein